MGSNPVLRIFDEKMKTQDYGLTGEGSMVPGHSMRIYSCKFLTED